MEVERWVVEVEEVIKTVSVICLYTHYTLYYLYYTINFLKVTSSVFYLTNTVCAVNILKSF